MLRHASAHAAVCRHSRRRHWSRASGRGRSRDCRSSRPEEIAGPGPARAARHPNVIRQPGVLAGRVQQAVVQRTAFDAKVQRQRGRFENGRLAAAIFANEEGHVGEADILTIIAHDAWMVILPDGRVDAVGEAARRPRGDRWRKFPCTCSRAENSRRQFIPASLSALPRCHPSPADRYRF